MKGTSWLAVIVLTGCVAIYALGSATHAYRLAQLRKPVDDGLKAMPEAKRQGVAVELSMGFYIANAAMLPDLCKAEGVDLTGYVHDFTQRYSADYDNARTVYTRLGGVESMLVADIHSATNTRGTFEHIVGTVAGLHGDKAHRADDCRSILARKDKIVDEMNFRELFPYAWGATGLP
jgi:hypothetical protein